MGTTYYATQIIFGKKKPLKIFREFAGRIIVEYPDMIYNIRYCYIHCVVIEDEYGKKVSSDELKAILCSPIYDETGTQV